ncbi:MAG: hypothetical protein R3F59_32390 [Myxococcota bacterium]
MDVVLDWLEDRRGLPRAAPAPADELAALSARGVPAAGVGLYRVVGRDVCGLLPPVAPGVPSVLLDPADVGPDPRGGWVFARAGSGRVVWDGRVAFRTLHAEVALAGTVPDWLDRRPAQLLRGAEPLREVAVSAPLGRTLVPFGRGFAVADRHSVLVLDPSAGTVVRGPRHASPVVQIDVDGRQILSTDGQQVQVWAGSVVGRRALSSWNVRLWGGRVWVAADEGLLVWDVAADTVQWLASCTGLHDVAAGGVVLDERPAIERLVHGSRTPEVVATEAQEAGDAGLLADGTVWWVGARNRCRVVRMAPGASPRRAPSRGSTGGGAAGRCRRTGGGSRWGRGRRRWCCGTGVVRRLAVGADALAVETTGGWRW